MVRIIRIFLIWFVIWSVISLNSGCFDRILDSFFDGMAETQDEHSIQEKAQQLPGVYEIWGLFVEEKADCGAKILSGSTLTLVQPVKQ